MTAAQTDSVPSFGRFFESWELFRDPALAGAVVGLVLGYLGVYVVARRMVFLSAALSQCAGLGVALAFYAQLYWGFGDLAGSPRLGALFLTLATALVLTADRKAVATRRDSLLGFAFLMGSAGTLAVATRIVQETRDIQSLLSGSAVTVLPEDLRLVLLTALVVTSLHVWWVRGFVQTSIDPDSAMVRGLPVRLLDTALLLSLALAISLFTQILGALPVFAFSVLPATAALRLARNLTMALVLAGGIGAACGFFGYLTAFRYDLPVGASQTLVGIGFVALGEIIRRWALQAR
jgi:zinc transport system permease protein